jgi:hypothetical protein
MNKLTETRTLQGYAFWHPKTGCEWHSATIMSPRLTISDRADGWRIVPVMITVAAVEQERAA